MDFKKVLLFSLAVGVGDSTWSQTKKKEKAKEEKVEAQETKATSVKKVKRYKYGMAGCGPGSMVVSENKRWPQVGASYINNPTGVSYIPIVGPYIALLGFSQTFAISSGTSNCEAPTETDVARSFIENNHEVLQKDIARGSGESIDGLAKVLGCNDQVLLGTALRNNFSDIFSGTKDESTTKIIQSAPQSCTIHG